MKKALKDYSATELSNHLASIRFCERKEFCQIHHQEIMSLRDIDLLSVFFEFGYLKVIFSILKCDIADSEKEEFIIPSLSSMSNKLSCLQKSERMKLLKIYATNLCFTKKICNAGDFLIDFVHFHIFVSNLSNECADYFYSRDEIVNYKTSYRMFEVASISVIKKYFHSHHTINRKGKLSIKIVEIILKRDDLTLDDKKDLLLYIIYRININDESLRKIRNEVFI